MAYSHVPVMLQEVGKYLKVRPGGKFIDCTLGGAGYTLAIAKAVGKTGKVLGIDLDDLALENARRKIATKKLDNIVLVRDNFKNLIDIVAASFPAGTLFDGIVFDLGLSSAQLEDPKRGFSFKGERPLNMSFRSGEKAADDEAEKSTIKIVNQYPLLDLTKIFREYGEERHAYQIAKAIVAARRTRRFTTTADLTALLEKTIPVRHHSKIHPATKIFQALRMETNGELAALEQALPSAAELLKPAGRLVVVSFHSGEDRIVKRFFKDTADLQALTKKPLVPSEAEIENNPRARSAKLRAAAKI